MKFNVVIPARYGSTRLPGKPLQPIGNSPLIHHVVQRARESRAEQVLVATDDERVAECVAQCGAVPVMTATDHASGTDRIAEVAARGGWDDDTIVVNLQGDEPFMPGNLVRRVAEDLGQHADAAASTLCAPVADATELMDQNAVKVVIDRKGYALYFSRAPIPWDRDRFPLPREATVTAGLYRRHIGLYAYRVGFLHRYIQWPSCTLESVEKLEQLRILWQGERIHVCETDEDPGFGIDTQEDLQRAQQRIAAMQGCETAR